VKRVPALSLAALLILPAVARSAETPLSLRLLLTGASAGWVEPCG
jgi:hypothetical protein